MSPAAVSRAPPTNSLTALESNYIAARDTDEDMSSNMMDAGLDFDLLAEYLLEDGGGIFDMG